MQWVFNSKYLQCALVVLRLKKNRQTFSREEILVITCLWQNGCPALQKLFLSPVRTSSLVLLLTQIINSIINNYLYGTHGRGLWITQQSIISLGSLRRFCTFLSLSFPACPDFLQPFKPVSNACHRFLINCAPSAFLFSFRNLSEVPLDPQRISSARTLSPCRATWIGTSSHSSFGFSCINLY